MITLDRRVGVRPVRVDDLPTIEAIDFAADAEDSWRYRGAAPAPDVRRARLWGPRILDQRLFLALPTEAAIGYGTVYDHDLRSGIAWLAVVADTHRRRTGQAMAAMGAFVTAIFDEWPLRHLYAAAAGTDLDQYRSAIRMGIASEVGCLRDHERRPDGSTVDVRWLRITRDAWNEYAVPHLRPRMGRDG